jgi:hypothetical protein
VRQKNRRTRLLLLRPATENPRSTLPEQVSESAEIWIRDPIGVPRCSPQSGTPYTLPRGRTANVLSIRCLWPPKHTHHAHSMTPFTRFYRLTITHFQENLSHTSSGLEIQSTVSHESARAGPFPLAVGYQTIEQSVNNSEKNFLFHKRVRVSISSFCPLHSQNP